MHHKQITTEFDITAINRQAHGLDLVTPMSPQIRNARAHSDTGQLQLGEPSQPFGQRSQCGDFQ
ncbi:hypothetical protein D3C84_986430 [compost metagenome]